MKKITLWHRHNAKEERFEYNHYEDGWDVSATPSVVPDNNDRWAKEHAYMDGSTVRHLNEIKQPLEEAENSVLHIANVGGSIPSQAELVAETADAYCPNCEFYIVNERVTYEECCDNCGTKIEWHE